ncbi:MAG: YceI family protein, partial [Candidatus Tumulicola sp.]
MNPQLQEQATYAVDPVHSTVEFIVRHLMIAKVRGRFTTFTGQVELPSGSDLPSSISATIEAASIDTREEQRDTHLRSADFFDAEKFPQLTFKSTRIHGEPDDFTIDGDLTIHGATHPVKLNGTFEGRATDPWGTQRIGYAAHGKISRKDFGLTWNAALETGG